MLWNFETLSSQLNSPNLDSLALVSFISSRFWSFLILCVNRKWIEVWERIERKREHTEINRASVLSVHTLCLFMLEDGDYVKSYLNAAKRSIKDPNIMHTNVILDHTLVSRALCNILLKHTFEWMLQICAYTHLQWLQKLWRLWDYLDKFKLWVI